MASYYQHHETRKHTQREAKKSRKASVLAHLGKSSCERCGYSKSLCALDFHHLDPAQKASLVTGRGTFLEMVEEAKKCIVICANCHREVHEEERIVHDTGRPPSTNDPRILRYIELSASKTR
jgi:predicted HNH restriction endonuclease